MDTPASLGPGIYTDVIQLSICYDTACTKPALGSPFSIPVSYTVTASAGREFQERIIEQNLAVLAVDPTGSTLYGVTTASSTSSPQLLEINPASGAVTTLLTLPAAIGQLLVSPDGRYLYMLTQYQVSPSTQVIRVPISSMTIDQTVPVGTAILPVEAQIAVSPVNSNTWAVGFQSGNMLTVQIFDGSVARPDVWSVTSYSAGSPQPVWSSDATSLYVLDLNLDAVAVSSAGLGAGTLLQSGSAGQVGFNYGGNLQLVSGLLYNNGGKVLDPSTNTILGQYLIRNSPNLAQFAIDPVNNRAFASYGDTSPPVGVVDTIQSFDLTKFTPIWIARLPAGTRPLRWGSDGLAWVAPSPTTQFAYALYLINGSFVAPSTQQPASAASSRSGIPRAR
jgi:hypothetical protein